MTSAVDDVLPASSDAVSDDAVSDEGLLGVLADPLRWQILTLLAAEQLCTCHLVELTGARQTNISNHLRVLRRAGLVQAAPAGRYTYYQLLPEPLSGIAQQLSEMAAAAAAAATRRRPCP